MGSSDMEQRLTLRIREAGLRMTMARRAICRILAERESEFHTVASILERAGNRAEQLDPSTVYRTLDELVKIGLVHHIHLGAGQVGTWHLSVDQDHQHLVCEGCGTTIEIPVSELEAAFQDVQASHGFRVNAHHFTILGFCSECAPDDPAGGHR